MYRDSSIMCPADVVFDPGTATASGTAGKYSSVLREHPHGVG
jgi:hypothetical protein